jgi:hypothetical protein
MKSYRCRAANSRPIRSSAPPPSTSRTTASAAGLRLSNSTVPMACAIAGALELIDLFDRLHGWPSPEDEVRRREDESARESWRRVRAHYGTYG